MGGFQHRQSFFTGNSATAVVCLSNHNLEGAATYWGRFFRHIVNCQGACRFSRLQPLFHLAPEFRADCCARIVVLPLLNVRMPIFRRIEPFAALEKERGGQDDIPDDRIKFMLAVFCPMFVNDGAKLRFAGDAVFFAARQARETGRRRKVTKKPPPAMWLFGAANLNNRGSPL